MITPLNPQKFYNEIESLVIELKTDYMDAIVHYCTKNNIEIEAVASLIKSNSKFKAIIQNEGEDMNLLPKTVKLPL